MRRRTSLGSILVALFIVASSFLDGSSASAAARELNSYNWSGYAARGPVMDAVVLEFTVPEVTCTRDRQALSIWAGFGGLLERSLAQAGVQVICEGTNPRYNLFEQFTLGTGASMEGPQVAPGDYVRAVICPGRAGSSAGVCLPGAPSATEYMTSVAFRRGGTGDFQVWSESLIPNSWVNTRREAECIVERPRDANTLELLEAPTFTPPALRCLPYRSINPITRVNIADGGGGYSAYRLTLVPTPTSASRSDPGAGLAPAPLAATPLAPATTGEPGPLTATGSDPAAAPRLPERPPGPAAGIGGSLMTTAP